MATLVDSSEAALNSLIGRVGRRERLDRLRQQAIDETIDRLPTRLVIVSGVLDGQAAFRQLVRYREAADEMLLAMVEERPAVEWLWYLRRSDGLFDLNALDTTAPYCGRLAEVATSRSSAVALSGPQPDYPVTARAVLPLLRLREAVAVVYEIHSVLRLAGKGAPVRFRPHSLPDPEPDAVLSESIRTFDERTASDEGSPLFGVGLAARVSLTRPSDPRDVVPIVFDLPDATDVSLPAASRHPFDAVRAKFALGFFDLRQARVLASLKEARSLVWTPEFQASVLALVGLLHPQFIGTAAESGRGFMNLMRVGYEVTHAENWLGRADFAVEVLRDSGWTFGDHTIGLDAEGALEVLAHGDAILWPPKPAKPVFKVGDGWLVTDWHLVTQYFLDRIHRGEAGGGTSNAWAEAFELEVQDAIDDSPWRPPESFRALRGRTLRIDGQAVTDIDAIGASGKQLLIASCKSVVRTDAFDRGEYAAVRNLRTNCERYVRDLDEVTKTLQDQPRGDNYDFSGREVVGCVVLPFVPFLVSPESDRRNPMGWRHVLALQELVRRLRGA